MDTWRQWIRHRTANVNEYSTRYSVAIDAAQRTGADEWRLQSAANRQGSSGTIDRETGTVLSQREIQLQHLAREVYDERLKLGVSREQARKDLPLSTYTEAYWKVDLWNLMHFLQVRMDTHAQAEIREYAGIIGHEIVAKWVPIAWQAFLDYHFNGLHLSSGEVAVVASLLTGDFVGARKQAAQMGWLDVNPDSNQLRRNRERDEFLEKLADRFSFPVNWLSE